METASTEFKNSSYTTDEFIEQLGHKVTIIIPDARPITGRMISLSKKYLTLEHRDGRITKVRREDVSVISQVAQANRCDHYDHPTTPGINDGDVIREAYNALPDLLTYEQAEEKARMRKGL